MKTVSLKVQKSVFSMLQAQMRTVMFELADRWVSEKDYEDISDYAKAIRKVLPKQWKIERMSKRPFGVVISRAGFPTTMIFASTTKYGLRAA